MEAPSFVSRRVSMDTFHRNFYQSDGGKLLTKKYALCDIICFCITLLMLMLLFLLLYAPGGIEKETNTRWCAGGCKKR